MSSAVAGGAGSVPIASVVIPAHNEQSVIARCLDALLSDAAPGEFEVIVAANGCTDRTVEIVTAGPWADVRCLDLPAAGKPGALNAADASTTVFPRIYLDADIELRADAAREVVAALRGGTVLAGAPRPAPDASDCSWPVRLHYETWAMLPVTREGYVGSGVFGLSEQGHARVAPFPQIIAEDQYVRRCFRAEERLTTEGSFTLFPSRTARALVRRATRGRAGNIQLEQLGDRLQPEDSARGGSGLRPLLQNPRNLPRVAVFVAISLAIRVAGQRKVSRGDLDTWNRDDSTRAEPTVGPHAAGDRRSDTDDQQQEYV